MLPSSSSALDRRHRDVLGAISALLLLFGVFGVVMHGMAPSSVVAAASPTDLSDVELKPEIKQDPVAAPTTTSVPAPPKFAAPTFRAAFASPPERSVIGFSVDDFKVEMTYYVAGDSALVFGVGTMPVPGSVTVDLKRAAQASAVSGGGTLTSVVATAFQSHRAVKATIAVEGGVMHELIVQTPTQVAIIMVGGDGDPIKEFFDFRDSVELLA